MPTGQQYATNVPQAQLTVGIGAATTAFSVNSLTSWPATPFTAVLDIGTSLQEPIDVLGVSGNNITSCTRNIDGTSAFSHNINATLTHADIGRDFREARSHIDSAGPIDASGHNVHGLATGTVVGTSETQVLTNKTLTAAAFTGAQAMGSGAWSGTGSLSENTITATTMTFNGLTGANSSTTRFAGTTAGGSPASGTFVAGDVVYDTTYHVQWLCTAGGVPGTWALLGNGGGSAKQAAGSLTVPSWANTVRISWSARSSGSGGGGDFLNLRLNADTGSNYVWGMSTQTGTNGTTVTAVTPGATDTSIRIGVVPDTAQTANWFAAGQVTINNAQGNTFKPVASYFSGPITTTNIWAGNSGGLWTSTAAVTSVSIQTAAGGFNGTSVMSAEFLP